VGKGFLDGVRDVRGETNRDPTRGEVKVDQRQHRVKRTGESGWRYDLTRGGGQASKKESESAGKI